MTKGLTEFLFLKEQAKSYVSIHPPMQVRKVFIWKQNPGSQSEGEEVKPFSKEI